MMPFFAQGGFLSDLAALIGAIAGLVAGVFAIWKYLDERRKRLEAEGRRLVAEEGEKEAEVGKHELVVALRSASKHHRPTARTAAQW